MCMVSSARHTQQVSMKSFHKQMPLFWTGKRMNRDTFPEAVLNGQQLDLYALYREVVTRGGFK